MILTVRGKPVMRLEPIAPEKPAASDPFHRLASRAVKTGVSLSNKRMDKIIYGT
jgi:antitoxin (DNA-binding transcriptional repressor) of toxin-antitoxin stability system